MKQLPKNSLNVQTRTFFLAVLLIALIYIFSACSDSSNSGSINPNIHAQYFEISDSPVSTEESSYYLAWLKTSLTNCPENLVVPTGINGKKVQGLNTNAFGTYNINSVYIPQSVEFIPFMLLSDASVKKLTVPQKFREKFLIPAATEVIYY